MPYSFDANDMRFASTPGFTRADDFAAHLITPSPSFTSRVRRPPR